MYENKHNQLTTYVNDVYTLLRYHKAVRDDNALSTQSYNVAACKYDQREHIESQCS